MWNIMKAQRYQLKRDRVILLGVLFFIIVYFIFAINSVQEMGGDNGGLLFTGTFEMFVIFGTMVVLLVTGRICGWDFQDKTINYEVIYGHKRSEIYFGRAFLSLLSSFVLVSVMLFVPLLPCVIKGGWGPNVDLQDALLRMGLFYLAMFRFSCEVILLSFLIKNGFTTIFLCYIGLEIVAMPSIILNDVKYFWTAVMAQMTFFSTYQNSKNIFVDGKEVTYFISELTPSFVQSCIISSVVMGILSLIFGYLCFQKADLK